MSWLYSRALVEAYSADICSDGAQSALSSGNPTPQAYLSQDKMKAFSRLSRYGMTCKLLTDGHGEALLTSYLEDSHAKTSASQAREQASTASDRACGGTWHESLMKYDHDSHSWKTHQHLFDEVLPESSVILPKSGMIVDGVLWELTTSARRTEEKESGYWLAPCLPGNGGSHGKKQLKKMLWPTPMKSDGSISGTTAQQSRETPQLAAAVKIWEQTTPERRTAENESGFWPTPCLPGNGGSNGKAKLKAMLWPTPRTTGLDGGSNSRKAAKDRGMWPTPDCQNHRDGTKMRKDNNAAIGGRHGVSLHHAVAWPTPTASSGGAEPKGKTGRKLVTVVKNWPTPSASDNRDRGNIGSPAILRRKEKGKQIMLSQSVSTESGALNPDWVEWLMGWPIGWTGLKPLGMARFQRWQQQHSDI